MQSPAYAPTLLAESMVHTLDPVIFSITETLAVRWYGVAYLAGFVVAWVVAHLLARRGVIPITTALVGDFMTACVVGVVVGGRLGHIIFYDQHLLWQFTASPPFWGVFNLHKGGMSSHGGMVGTFLAMVWFARRHRVPLLAMCDIVCFTAPAGLMFGRLANWVNGELWGRTLPDTMQAAPPAWSVKFPEEAILIAQRALEAHPNDMAAAEALRRAQDLFTLAYTGNADAIRQVAHLVPARYPNQFIQAFTDGPVLVAVLVLVWLRPRRAGVIFAVFFITYGLLRVLSEQFREPDAHVFTIGPITLPMLLSAAMVAFGAALLFVVQRTNQPRIGGLLGPSAAGAPGVSHAPGSPQAPQSPR